MVEINLALFCAGGIALAITLFCLYRLAFIFLNWFQKFIFSGDALFWVIMGLLILTGAGIPFVLLLIFVRYHKR